MAFRNHQIWLDSTSDHDEPAWILSVENGDSSETISVHDTVEDALASAESRGLSLTECHDCGIYVEPEDDRVGCGCHCPHCNATL